MKRIKHPMFWAILILISGFTAMLIMWILIPGETGPGFFHYNAATWGDLIGLTLLVFSLGKYNQLGEDNKNGTPKNRFLLILPMIAAIIFGIIGAMVQFSWLLGSQGNWTIIKRENPIIFLGFKLTLRFTIPGEWHAIFFVFAFALIAYFSFLFFIRHGILDVKVRKETKPLTYISLISFAGNLYIALIATDNLGKQDADRLIPLVCLGAVIFFLLLIVLPSILTKQTLESSQRKELCLKETVAILAGAIAAIAVSTAIVCKNNIDLLAFCCCAVILCAYIWVEFNNEDKIKKLDTMRHIILSTGIPVAIVFICFRIPLSYMTAIWFIILICWPLIISYVYKGVFISYYKWKDDQSLMQPALRYLLLAPAALVIYIVVSTKIDPNNYDGVLQAILEKLDYPLVLIGLFIARKLFAPVKNLDEIAIESKQALCMKKVQYFKVLVIPFLCLILLLRETHEKFRGFNNSSWADSIIWCILLLLMPIIIYWFIKRTNKSKKTKAIIFYIMVFVCLLGIVIVKSKLYSVNISKSLLANTWNNGSDGLIKIAFVIVVCSVIVQVIGSSLMIKLSFGSNTFSVRGFDENYFIEFFKNTQIGERCILGGNILIGLIVSIAFLTSYYIGIDIPFLLILVISLLVSYIVIPALGHYLITEECQEICKKFYSGDPGIEIVKDGIMAFFVFLLAAGFPLFMLSYINRNEISAMRLILYILLGMFVMYSALRFCCINNKEHFKSIYNRPYYFTENVKDLSEEEKNKLIIFDDKDKNRENEIKEKNQFMMIELYKHLCKQCQFAFLACMIYSFVFAFVEILLTALLSHNEGICTTWDRYRDKHFPELSTELHNDNFSIVFKAKTLKEKSYDAGIYFESRNPRARYKKLDIIIYTADKDTKIRNYKKRDKHVTIEEKGECKYLVSITEKSSIREKKQYKLKVDSKFIDFPRIEIL